MMPSNSHKPNCLTNDARLHTSFVPGPKFLRDFLAGVEFASRRHPYTSSLYSRPSFRQSNLPQTFEDPGETQTAGIPLGEHLRGSKGGLLAPLLTSLAQFLISACVRTHLTLSETRQAEKYDLSEDPDADDAEQLTVSDRPDAQIERMLHFDLRLTASAVARFSQVRDYMELEKEPLRVLTALVDGTAHECLADAELVEALHRQVTFAIESLLHI